MLYIVMAHDGTDSEAPARRQRVRPRHLEAIKPVVEAGTLQLGGALLDADGAMVGSMMLLEADSEAEVRDLVEGDIYYREGVWTSYTVTPFKRAV